ncbi:MAG: dUTP diphosphatase [Clostridiales bacterium GWD2_32_19]|nr:MAG: dUTP diphosphatase [Clostridiales bacterium GWD2_32_19]
MRNRGFEVCKGYEDKNINLPKRQTAHSVGYDIEAAEDAVIPSLWKLVMSGKEVKPTILKTGVKVYFMEDEVAYIYNRSSNPIKRGMVFSLGTGVFECDYYGNESNDGEILIPFYNFFPVDINIKKGERIAQAVFQKFLKVDVDEANGERKGGFGSTE